MKKFTVGTFMLLLIFTACEKAPINKDASKKTTSQKTTTTYSTYSEVQDKPNWIKRAFDSLETGNYPNIKAIAWWHEDFDTSYLTVDSTPESLTEYKDGVASSTFVTTPNFDVTTNKLLAPTTGIYHAAYPDFGGTEDIVTAQKITDFETLVGKNITWAYFSNNWYTNNIVFPAADVTTIHNAGKVPFIRIMPRKDFSDGCTDKTYTMQKIINGDFDTELNAYALAAKNSGVNLLMEFGTEVNGNWFPWSGYCNGADETTYGTPPAALPDGPERFRDAYRHVIDIFNNNNVDNVTWFFHINGYGSPYEVDYPWNEMANYYPGDNYIDWLGVSIYGPQTSDYSYYEELSQTLDHCYPRLTSISATKPIAILEFAISEKQNLSIEEF